jgi:hypothetical protein
MSLNITPERLRAYLDDRLSETEAATIEKELRANPELRELLEVVRNRSVNTGHSLGAVWQRERLTCPTREQLNSYLRELLEDDYQAYVHFHLFKIGCPYCVANLEDLQELQAEPAQSEQRRDRIFESSVGILRENKS